MGPLTLVALERNFLATFVNEKTEKIKETYKVLLLNII